MGSDGAFYVADSGNATIRRVTPAGVVTTIAGSPGSIGNVDATGASARFGYPAGMVCDGSGTLYVSDGLNNTIRKVTIAGVTTTIAGNGSTTPSDAIGTAAGIPSPGGLALSANVLYVTAKGSVGFTEAGQVRAIDLSTAAVTTYAGQAAWPTTPQLLQFADGAPTQAVFSFDAFDTSNDSQAGNFASLAVTPNGSLIVSDPGNQALRQISSAQSTSTLVFGSRPTTTGDGVINARGVFDDKASGGLTFAVDASGNIAVADSGSGGDVRSISSAGVVTTIAGLHDVQGTVQGKGTAAQFKAPSGIVAAADGSFLVADANNSVIRRITVDGTVSIFAGQFGHPGTADGASTVATFGNPTGLVQAADGTLYTLDENGTTVRRIDTLGNVTTLAGMADSFGDVDGPGPTARFNSVRALAIDASGNLFIADPEDEAIRKVTPAGVVSTVLYAQAPGDTSAGLNVFFGLAVGADGTIFICDYSHDEIRAISTSGVLTTIAGVDDGLATRVGSDPRIQLPFGVTVLGPKTLLISAVKDYSDVVAQSVYVLTLP